MPRVPTDNRKIQTAALPGVRMAEVSPDAFGAGLGEGIQRAAGTIQTQVLGPEWDRANRARIDDATTKLAQKRLELGSRLKQAQGEHAMGASEPLEREFEDARNQLRQSLSNNAQRDAFDQDANRLGLGLRDAIDSHVIAQGEAVAEQKASARVSTMLQSAIANRADPILAWQDQQDAQATLEEYDRSRGVPDEARKARQDALRSGFVADTIATLADDGDHVQASKWLERHGDALSPKDLARARKVLEVANERGESQRLVDEIMADEGATIESAMAAAAKIRDPNLRAAVEQRSVTMLALRERARAAKDEGTFRQAYDIFADPANPRGLDAVPPTLMASLRPEHQEQLRAYAAARDRGERITTDWTAYYGLRSAAADERQRDRFLNANLLEYRGRLADEQFKELVKIQADMRGDLSGPKAQEHLAQITAENDVVRQTLGPLVKDLTIKKGNPDNAMIIGFSEALRRRITGLQSVQKRRLTREEVQAEADDLIKREVVSTAVPSKWNIVKDMLPFGGLAGDSMTTSESERYAFENPAVANRAYSVAQVPPEEADAIRAALNRAGRPVSETAIVDLYNTKLRQAPNAP